MKLAYSVYGDGPALVILHGVFGSKTNWRSFAKRLAEDYRVYALDLRNHGESPWADTMTYAAMAEDVREFLTSTGHERATVVGHSMGGKAAMVLALMHPRTVGALAVVDIAPVAYAHDFGSYIDAMKTLDLGQIATRREADAALGERIPDASARGLLLQNLVRHDHRFEWRLNLHALNAHRDSLTGFPESALGRHYDGPVLFAHGSRSDYVQPAHRKRMDDLFPHASIESISDASHWVHVEQPQALASRLRAFLDDAA